MFDMTNPARRVSWKIAGVGMVVLSLNCDILRKNPRDSQCSKILQMNGRGIGLKAAGCHPSMPDRRSRPGLLHLILAPLFKIFLGLLLGGAALSGGAVPAPEGTRLTYVVTRDGKPIGEYRFTLEDHPDRREVTVAMTVKVKMLFLTVYEAEHSRHDVWIDGRLERSQGRSTYIGNAFEVDLARQEPAYVLTVNGTPRALNGPVMTFVPWWPAVSGEVAQISEKGRVDLATIEPGGSETLTLGGKAITARKYTLLGHRPEELWYDEQGTLLQVRYRSKGSVIELRLSETAPVPAPGA